MSLFIVRLAYHAMNCGEQTGSGVRGVERTKGLGAVTAQRASSRQDSQVWFRPAPCSRIACQEDGVNWVGKCRRKLMLVEHLTECFSI